MNTKHPLSFLMDIEKSINTKTKNKIKEEIKQYLQEYKCCAFCSNYGKHDNCPESEDFKYMRLYWCDHYKDKRG